MPDVRSPIAARAKGVRRMVVGWIAGSRLPFSVASLEHGPVDLNGR
jgi:hypothetical protein